MSLDKNIVIVSKFGSKSPGNYISRYTSREDATESLEIGDYISKYSSRYSAAEQLKYEHPTENEVASKDIELKGRDGILFGSNGLSYSEDELFQAAKDTQKAVDNGHIVIMPVISFEHEYLVERGIIPKDTPKATKAGDYRGKVDQLKLRQGITKMMDAMHREMGFSEPIWTGSIQTDTKNVHAHITTVESGTPKDKRLKKVFKTREEKRPDMKWLTEQTDDYEMTINEGLIEYVKDGETLARQTTSQKGHPKFYTATVKTDEEEYVEKGMITEKTRLKMRNAMDRELQATKDIRPYVKEIGERRKLTKDLTSRVVLYNDTSVEKLQQLIAALPESKKAWRASSKRKDMQRPNELANELVDDIWTRLNKTIELDSFDESVKDYITVRTADEKLTQEKQDELYQGAYSRLREESINSIYKTAKTVKDKDKTVKRTKYSVKAASTEALQNEIEDMHDRKARGYDGAVLNEYRERSYESRFKDAVYESNRYQQSIEEYNTLSALGKTSEDSKVVQNHYRLEYVYHRKRADKYSYLRFGEKNSNVSKTRFKNVRGVDLVDMIYDYGPKDSRDVPRKVASNYKAQTEKRVEAMRGTMRYLIQTGQFEAYEALKAQRDLLAREYRVANVIDKELSVPRGGKNGKDTLKLRSTIDTARGRRLLRTELRDIETKTKEARDNYRKGVDEGRLEKLPKYNPKIDNKNVDWTKDASEDTPLHELHAKEREFWIQQRIQFDNYIRKQRAFEEKREREEALEKEREEIERELKEQAKESREETADKEIYEETYEVVPDEVYEVVPDEAYENYEDALGDFVDMYDGDYESSIAELEDTIYEDYDEDYEALMAEMQTPVFDDYEEATETQSESEDDVYEEYEEMVDNMPPPPPPEAFDNYDAMMEDIPAPVQDDYEAMMDEFGPPPVPPEEEMIPDMEIPPPSDADIPPVDYGGMIDESEIPPPEGDYDEILAEEVEAELKRRKMKENEDYDKGFELDL